MKIISKIWAVVFLFALVFAISGKTIHIFCEKGHNHDFVCTENATHFHEQEESCFICEFDLQLSDNYLFNAPQLNIDVQLKEECSTAISFVYAQTHKQLTSRGPPAA